jgi:O-methyltransferase involved in polyketide biosynthesis
MSHQEPVKVTLQGVEETMLLPLWARAAETGRSHPIIRDEQAVRMVAGIDYDFRIFGRNWQNEVIMQTAIAVRTEILDRAVRDFIARHPEGVVVNVGAGLDTRFYRLDNGRLRWFDVDLPRAIAMRRQFLTESDRHRFVTRSFLDPDWLDDIDAGDAPMLVVAEGLFMYFEEAQVRGFLTGLAERRPGTEVVFEAIDPGLVLIMNTQGWVRQLGTPFKWGLWDGRDLTRWGLRFIAQWHQLDYHPARWGPMALFKHVPPLRGWMKIVHVQAGNQS